MEVHYWTVGIKFWHLSLSKIYIECLSDSNLTEVEFKDMHLIISFPLPLQIFTLYVQKSHKGITRLTRSLLQMTMMRYWKVKVIQSCLTLCDPEGIQCMELSRPEAWKCECALSRSVVSDSATPWTVALQAPLSMGFSRPEHWSGLPCPPPGIFPNQVSHIAGGFFTSWATKKTLHYWNKI